MRNEVASLLAVATAFMGCGAPNKSRRAPLIESTSASSLGDPRHEDRQESKQATNSPSASVATTVASPVQRLAETDRHEVTITRAEYADAWPFTVDSGVLAGKPTGRKLPGGTVLAEVTFTTGGKTYYVNGIAKGTGRYAELNDIWARDPSAPKEWGLKKNMGPIIDRGLTLARGTNEPLVEPKPAPAPVAVASGPIRCDQFDISAAFDTNPIGSVRRVRISIQTDLPDATNLIVSIDRSFVNAADNKEYAIDYLEEKATVAGWLAGRVVELDQAKWQAKLDEKGATLRALGKSLTPTRLDSSITIAFVVPINQLDRRFGLRNANLVGAAVQESSGLRIVRREAKLEWLVPVQ